MRIAVTSSAALQVTSQNICKPIGWDHYHPLDTVNMHSSQPDVLLLGGFYVGNLNDEWFYRSLTGRIPKIVIHWFGTDVVMMRQYREDGAKGIFDELRTDRFLHIPCSDKIRRELIEDLEFPVCDPLIVPSEDPLSRMKTPKGRFKLAVYMPPGRSDFFRIPIIAEAVDAIPKIHVIFYHFLERADSYGIDASHEYRYGLSHEEYHGVVEECSALLRIPTHDGMSVGAAEFLMAGRKVISNHSLPMWPAKIKNLSVESVKLELEKAMKRSSVSVKVSDEARRLFDPALYAEGMQKRLRDKWGIDVDRSVGVVAA